MGQSSRQRPLSLMELPRAWPFCSQYKLLPLSGHSLRTHHPSTTRTLGQPGRCLPSALPCTTSNTTPRTCHRLVLLKYRMLHLLSSSKRL
ncbi:hypothetical protein CPB84DRAFT_1958646 [Gymnopilus junonius]|uniref:Uncharacterized protein n=1 Tax=Gymnopilus junonius TaxID=109634 RepID=A0A9P5TRW5_GYMJU|nr:hypothetical protein CPB84DRAFT_1958646 [Gymnopilus junonius]